MLVLTDLNSIKLFKQLFQLKMGLIFASTLTEVLAAVVLFCWGIYYHVTKNYDYWAKRGVPHRKGAFPFGSMKDLITARVSLGDAYDDVYKEFRGERYCGVYVIHRPVLVVRDPELIKRIMVADFTHFTDRDPFPANSKEYLNRHLFLVAGDVWRNMRHKLTPAFTSGKMKNMFFLMLKCSDNLGAYLEKTAETQKTFNVKELLAKFTMDVIATCAFGMEINSLRDENVEFYKTGTSIFKPSVPLFVKSMFIFLFPAVAEALNVHNNKKKPKEMFTEMIRSTVKYREENDISRNDFLDLLIKLRNNKSILDGTEEDEYLSNQSKSNEVEGKNRYEII